jgi:hypothetical protein
LLILVVTALWVARHDGQVELGQINPDACDFAVAAPEAHLCEAAAGFAHLVMAVEALDAHVRLGCCHAVDLTVARSAQVPVIVPDGLFQAH